MKKDDKQTNDQPYKKSEKDLDLDAISKNDNSSNKPIVYNLDEEPIAVIDTSKFKDRLSVKEWGKLKKQNPTTITPDQKKLLEVTDTSVKKELGQIAPQLNEITKLGKMMNKTIGRFDFSSITPKMMPTLPTVPTIEPYRSDLLENVNLIKNIVPPASSDEQAKQTALLEHMVEAFEAQNAERDADTRKLLRPSYDTKSHKLIFANTIIDIPSGDQQDLCRILFKKSKPSKPVNIGDALMKMDILIDNIKGNKKVYYTKAHLNDTVAKAVQIGDLVVVDNKKILINKKYQ
jgi:hypothetical protein